MTNSSGRNASIQFNSIFMGLLLLVLTGLLAWLSTRYTYEADWTRNAKHTLSEASKQMLAGIEGPLQITAYAREREELRTAIKKFIGRYQRIKSDIELRFINPDVVPDEIRILGINVNGELLIKYQGKTEHVRSGSEQEFTNALQRLLRGSERWLAFIEGHGERSSVGKANHDISEWSSQLSSRGFKFQPVNLAQSSIPDNTSVLIIAGPLVSLLQGEVEHILNYLAKGGNLLWLGEPGEMHGLEPVAHYLGIEFLQGAVVDFASHLVGINDPTITLLTEKLYASHAALEKFSFATLFPMATAIATDKASGWKVKPLLTTAEHTWQERGELKGEIGFDKDTDIRGPLAIALSLERELEQTDGDELVIKQQRIIVTGDGDFLSNTYVGNSGNMELGIRLINWLTHDDNFISIPVHTAEDLQLNLPPMIAGILGIGFLIVLPLVFACTGVFVWWRRKNL